MAVPGKPIVPGSLPVNRIVPVSVPTCAKCESQQFKASARTVPGWKFGLCFIHCSRCGAVVSVIEATSAAVMVENLTGEVRKLKFRMK